MSTEYTVEEIDVQPIRSPTILNTAYQDVMLWNGQFGATKTNAGTEGNWTAGTPKENNELGFEGLETQAIAGIGVHRLKYNEDMLFKMGYQQYFDDAFPNINKTERYSEVYAGLAIAAFERSVLASEAPFQKWLQGNKSALNEEEVKGGALFFGKGKCYSCHSGPGLNSNTFHALGFKDFSMEDTHIKVDMATRKGRGGFTQNPEDDYKFKTPTLYNLKDVHFLGHGGSFSSVKQIIEYKNLGVAENQGVPKDQVSPFFAPLELTPNEVDQLTMFVENALYDPSLDRFVPDNLPSGNCFPVADEKSRIDLNCN